MSSHHFVKEGQEPALLILEPFSYTLIEPLLEWAPLVIVVDFAVDVVLQWGIKIDMVLANVDQVERLKVKLTEQSPVKILSYLPSEDSLHVGLDFLITSKQTAVNIMSAQTDSILEKTKDFSSQLNISIISKDIRWSAISSGSFEKWLPFHANLYVKGQPQQDIIMNNLTPKMGCFEAQKDGMVSIQSSDMFWVGESV